MLSNVVASPPVVPSSYSSLLVPINADVAFHRWCDNVGIRINPAVKVITSEKSVAGRGIFAIEDLEENEIIAQIPTAVVFHPDNCAHCFPETARLISKSKARVGIVGDADNQDKKKFNWIHRLWRKVIKKNKKTKKTNQEEPKFYHLDTDELWQPELTMYALQAIRDGHPWSTWISQWKRDDPTYKLFCSNVKVRDENQIDVAAQELKSFAPYLDPLHIKAALTIRLLRLDEERQVIPLHDNSETSGMYALLGSRAVALDDRVTGIIPFHDMINHSLDPNLSISYVDDYIQIYANRRIDRDQELFLCYTKLHKAMDSINALWSLVQWGIPIPKEQLLRVN